MKTLIIKSILILSVIINYTTSNLTTSKDPVKVTATYNGFTELGYTFSFVNDDEEDEVITFESISEKLLDLYDLTDDNYIDERFEITFEYKQIDEEDDTKVPVLQTIKKVN